MFYMFVIAGLIYFWSLIHAGNHHPTPPPMPDGSDIWYAFVPPPPAEEIEEREIAA